MIFVSAAACAMLAEAPVGPVSPIPALPDLVAIVLGHRRPRRERRPDQAWQLGQLGEWQLGEWQPSWTPEHHARAVERVREAIGRGDVYQVTVVGHAAAPYRGDPGPALWRVAQLPGARHATVLRGSGWAVACASPETLLHVERGIDATVVQTRPIKGTRPATAEGWYELMTSPKERAEHVMIVDLSRNDLARVAQVGTVEVPRLFEVQRWCDLWQAESTVTAQLEPDTDLPALLRAVCPGGSVTGAPKRAALDQIAALEPVGRGASMGAIGWLDHDRLELGLTIRTVALDADRVHVWAGGGITWDSDPVAEVAEAEQKAAPLRAALAGEGA